MFFKTILALLDLESPESELVSLIELCQSAGAHLTLLIIGLTPPPPMSAGYGAGAFEVWGEDFNRLSQELNAKMDEAKAWLIEHAPPDLSYEVGTEYSQPGVLGREIARRARFADVTVIAGRFQLKSSVWQQALKGALFGTGRPVLVLNEKQLSLSEVSNIQLAYDGGEQAALAVRQSLQIMRASNEVSVVMVDPQSASERFGDEPGADLATYLSRHDIHVTISPVASGGQSVSAALLKHADHIDADLIVMGGYGHSRLQDWLLGSTTEHMLESCERPLFLAH